MLGASLEEQSRIHAASAMQIANGCVDAQVTEKGRPDAIDKDLHLPKPDLVSLGNKCFSCTEIYKSWETFNIHL